MNQLVEFTQPPNTSVGRTGQRVSVNPFHVTAIEEKEFSTIIHVVGRGSFLVKKSYEDVVKIIAGVLASNDTAIG